MNTNKNGTVAPFLRIADDVRHYCHLFLQTDDILQIVRVCRRWKEIHSTFWLAKLEQEFPFVYCAKKKVELSAENIFFAQAKKMYQQTLKDFQSNPDRLFEYFRTTFQSADKTMWKVWKNKNGALAPFLIKPDRISEPSSQRVWKFDLDNRRQAHRKVSQPLNILSLVEASGFVRLEMPLFDPQVHCIALAGRMLFVQFTSREIILFDLFKSSNKPLATFFLLEE